MEKWRLLKLGEMDDFTFTVMFEALGIAKDRGIISNTVALHHSSRIARIGRQTNISNLNVALCREKDIPVVRCFFDAGVGLYENQYECIIVIDKDFFINEDVAYDSFIRCLVKSCQILGLTASYRPNSNDVLVGGRKIAGTVRPSFNNALFLSMSLTLDFDYNLADKVLRIPAKKFKDKEAKTVREWVTSARRELGREVSSQEVEDAFLNGFSDVLGIQFEESELTDEEIKILDELIPKYRSESWLKYGRWSPVEEYWRPE